MTTLEQSILEDATRNIAAGLNRIVIETARERYPRECVAIDGFIARGATRQLIANALRNKFGISLKAMWLMDYADSRITQKERGR